MRRILLIIMICFICFGFLAGETGLAASAEAYRLGSGDVITVSVWGYPELQVPELTIRPDGKIAIPLVGEIQAAGLTPVELTAEITRSLGDFVKEPKVTVNVIKFRTTRVYVLGEVNKPGLYEIEKEHRVLDALAAAGGFTRSSDKGKVYLVRKDDQKNYTLINLNELLKKGDMSQNYILNDGDTLFLARHKLDYMKEILPFITAWAQIEDIRDNN